MDQEPGVFPRENTVTGRHPIFARFRAQDVPADGRFWTDWLGVRARRSFHAHYDEGNGVGYIRPQVQPIASEYFEWISLLCAAAAAEPPFTMFELGSGWGRWLLRGGLACRQLGKEFRLVGIEAETCHFEWMRMAFRDNGIDPEAHLLVNAAVGRDLGEAWFLSGNSREWYGQSLLTPIQVEWAHRQAERSRAATTSDPTAPPKDVHKVRVVPLGELLEKYPRVHLLNMDIQNAEADVVEGSAEPIDARVELAHISTHSPEVERRLRGVFARLGWLKLFDFECQGQRCTPYGEVGFVDGVQTWLNPTAHRLLDWFCDPSLLRFSVAQNCLWQQKWQQGEDLHAIDLRALQDRLETAEKSLDSMRLQKEDAETQLAQVREEWQRQRNATALRRLARKFPRLAQGVKQVLLPLTHRQSA